MVKRDLCFHLFLDLCPSDTANTAIVDKADYECVGASEIASAGGAHAARGLIHPIHVTL